MNESTFSVVLSSDATAVVRYADGHTLVRVAGEVDECAAATCETVVDLAAARSEPVHVDLSDVTLFSAAGVTWLVRLYRHAVGGVQVVAASEPVREVLRACGTPTASRGGLPSPRQAALR